MGIERGGGGGGFKLRGAWSVAAKTCDSCHSAAVALYCRTDSAFLCITCDSKLHSLLNKFTPRHERVWMCEVCEQAPASVTCKADAAALCVACDSDIHSANPLAQRHDRIPIEPFVDPVDSIVKTSATSVASFNFLLPTDDHSAIVSSELETTPWLIADPNLNPKLLDDSEMKPSSDVFFPELDPFLEFDYPNSLDTGFHNSNYNCANDSVVPIQTKPPLAPSPPVFENNSEICFDVDFCRSKLSSFSYQTHSVSQCFSSSSLEVGVVPDGNSGSETSYSFGRGGGEPSGSAGQYGGIDREARVLRYREKRKNRKFEKTIRYASRKAYAETRPRIKGRFAKRPETQSGMDQIASASLLPADIQYGVVPSFLT